MNRTRWNLLIAALVLSNLVLLGVRLPWPSMAQAHPADADTPGEPASTMTSLEEEWEATEVAGTVKNGPDFCVVGLKRPFTQAVTPIDALGVVTAGKAGVGAGYSHDDDDKGGGPPGSSALAATLIVTRWHVRGHVHRARGRP